jgi:hypothetical protein
MRRVWIPVAAVLSMTVSTGCSSKYWPLLNDDAVTLWIRGGDEPIDIDGDEFRASVQLCLCKTDANWPCGTRVVPEGYDDDVLALEEDELGHNEIECTETGDVLGGIKNARCGGLLQKADEGMEFRALVNGTLVARLTMPARPRLTSPKNGSAISVSAVDGIPISWTPGAPGDSLHWLLIETFSVDGSCSPDVVWPKESDGDLEDTGSFTIPKDLLPTNLPPEGCSVDITLSRKRLGTVEPVLKDGNLSADQYGSVTVILKP